MGRVNKLTSGVFTDIIGNEEEKPDFIRFIDAQSNLQKPKTDLKSYLSKYKKIIEENRSIFDELGLIETIIMQMRSRDNIQTDDIKLNIVREYIYARIPFHRNDKEGKDIRVIVGMVENYGSDVTKLYDNTDLMTIAKNRLTWAMNNHITDNIQKLGKLKS